MLPHRPVLYQEIIHALRPSSPGIYVDGTVGAGGHAAAILEASSPDGKLLGFDVDPSAISISKNRLAEYGERVTLVRASYTTLINQLNEIGWGLVEGIVLDLGASSMQFDRKERGFSFQSDAPLDMRFDPSSTTTAELLINSLSQTELADMIFRNSDEKYARRIATAIIEARPLSSTKQLVEVITSVVKRRPHGIHPATRTFQAIRIAVNQELESIELVLPQLTAALKPGGRIAVISFHSLEDRLVKRYMREKSKSITRQPDDLPEVEDRKAELKLINRRPIQASETEIVENPRARSARLRVAEKLA
ncbi:MAG: 16S rRNA (cytosine(1402)-N(4))-methyltransferase RsmH [Chloroflexota bacterium]